MSLSFNHLGLVKLLSEKDYLVQRHPTLWLHTITSMDEDTSDKNTNGDNPSQPEAND